MSISYAELFRNTHGYDPAWNDGHWLLRSQLMPQETPKEAEGEKGVIELKVPFCCEACPDKVYKKLRDMDGVTSVHCDLLNQKVTVRGTVKPEKVLKRVQKIKAMSEMWKNK